MNKRRTTLKSLLAAGMLVPSYSLRAVAAAASRLKLEASRAAASRRFRAVLVLIILSPWGSGKPPAC